MTRLNKLKSVLNSFHSDRSGGVAMIFALSLIPLLAVAGFAIDFQMTVMRKNKVQVVMDSAVLAGAKQMQTGATEEEVREYVRNYMTAQINMAGNGLTCGTISVEFSQTGEEIDSEVTCQQSTTLMNLVGSEYMPFKVDSSSTWGIGKLDVAFMFDVSGSMSSNSRMTNLKEAAQDAVDILLPENGGPATEDVRIAMISYDTSFNAGDYFSEVTGLNETRTYYAEYMEEYEYEEEIESTCTVEVEEDVTYTDERCTKQDSDRCKRYKKNGQCRKYYQEWVCEEYEYTVTETRWEDQPCMETVTLTGTRVAETSKTITNTCVYERPGNHAFLDTAPIQGTPLAQIYGATDTVIYHKGMAGTQSGDSAVNDATNVNGYLAAGYAIFNSDEDEDDGGDWDVYGTTCNQHEPVPLTDNRTTLSNYITSLTTNGYTAGQQGIAWAWYMVAEPWETVFTGDNAPLPYDEPDSTKAIILMTDGSFNMQEFNSDLGNSVTQAQAVCDQIREDDNLFVYTVAFQAPTAGKAILNYCATSPEFAFEPESAAELSDAYQQIATSIADLRISR